MFCKNCGAQNPDEARFCKGCGNPLEAPVQRYQPQSQPQPQPQAMYQQYRQPILYSSNPVLNIIKSTTASTMFMISTIIVSSALFFNLIGMIAGNNYLFRFIDKMLGELYIDSDLSDGSFLLALFELSPTIVILAGLWLLFVAGRNRLTGGMNPTGFVMIRIVSLIQFISYAVYAAITITIFFVTIAEIPDYYLDDIIGALILIVFLLLGIFAVNMIYNMMLVKTLAALTRNVATGEKISTISMFIVVWNFFIALGNTIMAIIAVGGDDVLRFFSLMLSGAAAVMFSIMILNYNKRAVASGYAAAVPLAAPKAAPYAVQYNYPPQNGQNGNNWQ